MELSLHSCSVEGYGVAKLSVSGEPNQEPGPAFLEGEAKSASAGYLDQGPGNVTLLAFF